MANKSHTGSAADIAAAMLRVFRGNDRSHGSFNPALKPDSCMSMVKSSPTATLFENHLIGRRGLGISPIMDDGRCYWGAIDIDNHGADAADVDIMTISQQVEAKRIPALVCRSKSGGAHVYVFFSSPKSAWMVKRLLRVWAAQLGFDGSEIFPKQGGLSPDPDTGERPYGSWINMPYFDCMSKDADEGARYCVRKGKRLTVSEFLDAVSEVSIPEISNLALIEHQDAPPCIQRMITEGVTSGYRNQALYNLCVYLAKAFPSSWRDMAMELNQEIFDEPLSKEEFSKTAKSAGGKKYKYKCNEEPCKMLCAGSSGICTTRKFGIIPNEAPDEDTGLPEFSDLRKYNVEPVRWVVAVNGVDVNFTTPDLLNPSRVREAIADKLTLLISPMKIVDWSRKLKELMSSARVIDAPEEASLVGVLRQRLAEFIQKADLNTDGEDRTMRNALLVGAPVLQIRKDERVIYFRGSDFLEYLRKIKFDTSSSLMGPSIWVALRNMDVGYERLRINSTTTREVWYVPVTNDNTMRIESIDLKDEI